MTGIIIDKFKNEIFVFADGRNTLGEVVVSDTDTKIYHEGDHIITGPGSVHDICELLEIYRENPYITAFDIKQLKSREADLVIVTKNKIITLLLSKKEANRGRFELEHSCLPLFLGSGMIALRSAYLATDVGLSSNRKIYLDNIRNAFTIASKVIITMNGLYQTESLKLDAKKS